MYETILSTEGASPKVFYMTCHVQIFQILSFNAVLIPYMEYFNLVFRFFLFVRRQSWIKLNIQYTILYNLNDLQFNVYDVSDVS